MSLNNKSSKKKNLLTNCFILNKGFYFFFILFTYSYEIKS